MIRYLLKRILIFAPTLVVISLLAFALSKMAPGDPVELRQSAGSVPIASGAREADRMYAETARLMGLDKPVFYFSLSSAAYPDTLHRVQRLDRRQTLRRLIGIYGNWPAVQNYYSAIATTEQAIAAAPAQTGYALGKPLRDLYLLHEERSVRARLDTLRATLQRDSTLQGPPRESIEALQRHFDQLIASPARRLLYRPAFQWHGFDNQYHAWISGYLRGNFGASYQDGRPVRNKLSDALRWTLLLNLITLVLAFGMAIPIGVWAAQRVGGRFDRSTTIVLFMLYSLPLFWVATILQVFFTTPEYGMDWFPTSGLSELPSSASWGKRFMNQAAHLFLPVFCLTYGSLAFISRQMRGGMLQVLDQDYIRTARAKGLSENRVIWKHAFRNAIFPIITLIGSIFPSVLAGSVVIEVIFGIPGMGKLTVDAIFARDWPVVFAVLMMASVLTVIGLLVADMLYAWADPRVRFRSRGQRAPH
jgi:peptide/nickel transport system permease protein